jgi:uridine nucleosidase
MASPATAGAAAAASPASPARPSTATPVWFDCDPGHDDALALILAGYSPSLNLLGISTVAGNQSIEKTTVNALNVLHVAALEHLPVYAGREQPILRKGVQCPEIHGVSGWANNKQAQLRYG